MTIFSFCNWYQVIIAKVLGMYASIDKAINIVTWFAYA